MQVRFGNLSLLRFEQKVEVDFNDEDLIWLNQHRIDSANFKDDDKFHIFDLPLGILAGCDIAEELVTRLRKYTFEKQFYVETKESEGKSDS